MARLSIGKAWEETVPFVRREASLMLPVALMFLAVPIAVVGQMIPPDFMTSLSRANGQLPPIPGSLLLAFAIMVLLLQTGSLALLALALKPNISVAEALSLAVRRLPIIVGASLLLFAAMLLLGVGASILGAVIGLIGGSAFGGSLALLLLMAAAVYCATRLSLLIAVVADRSLGPVASVRASWSLSAGQYWRLLAFLLLSLVVAQIVSLAFASLFGIAGGLIGGQMLASLLAGLVSALVGAVVQTYVATMTARLYRQAEG